MIDGAAALRALVLAVACAGAGGCSQAPRQSPDVPTRPLRVSDLAKTDIDQVTEIVLDETLGLLEELTTKLYRRNPAAWKQHDKPSPAFVVARVFRPERVPDFVELGGRRDIDAIRLAFEPAFGGDRVLAFAAGLTSMIEKAYGGKREFFLLDELDPQKLYNCARNVEVAAWLLRSRTDGAGHPLILSHSIDGEPLNLSFERLFGKIIVLQDMLARVVAERTNRTVRKVVHRVVGAVFLPI